MAPHKGVTGLKPKIHRKAFKNLLRNLMAEILEICSMVFTKFVQNGSIPVHPGFASKLFLKNLLVQAQLLEIWYVALPCGA